MPSVGTLPFGILLRRYRVAASLTQEELSARTGVSVRTISDLERGVFRRPRKDTLALLVEALALSEQERTAFASALRSLSPPTDSTATDARPSTGPLHTLPQSLKPLTLLVGRERDEAAVAYLLQHTETRLLTLVGPAGIGKTRLAWQVAVDLSDAYADGVCFVDLAPLQEAQLVLPSIARALGLHDAGSHPIAEALQTSLRDKHLLLLLDNFEQVVAAATEVTALLATCPHITALVTSRAVLHVHGEQELAVLPLALPDPDPDPTHLPSVEDLGRYAAVALFVQRAHAVKPAFALTIANAPMVVAICRHLDGLPLAIELAAARVKLLPLPALLTRLEHRMDVLTDGARDLPERQRTMERAISWSYDLLDDGERALFQQLTVFVGGWTLEAAETVYGEAGDRGIGVLEGLGALVDKSLVQEAATGEEPRFRMLATIREYGLEQLTVHQGLNALRQRHAAYYLALAERAERELTGSEQAEWMGRLSRDHDNLRAVLQWAREQKDSELGLRLAGALFRFWVARAVGEGRGWLEDLLARDAKAGACAASGAARIKALNAASYLAHRQGDCAATRVHAEESLALSRRLGDAWGVASSLANLGNAAQGQGDYDRATAFYEESVALYREIGDTPGIATMLNNLAINAVLGHADFARALTLYQEALVLQRSVGNRGGEATALLNLGTTFSDKSDYEQAMMPLEASLALFRALNDHGGTAHALQSLGALARHQGHLAQALSLLRESIEMNRRVDSKGLTASTLEEMAALTAAQGEFERAAQLYGRAEALREAIGYPIAPGNHAAYDREVANIQGALSRLAFAAAWAAGRLLPLDEALSFF